MIELQQIKTEQKVKRKIEPRQRKRGLRQRKIELRQRTYSKDKENGANTKKDSYIKDREFNKDG